MMAATPLLEIQDLTYAYPDGTRALSQVSFAVAEGQRVGIVGPNGAGKSTLLLLLSGILQGQGEIRVGGLRLEKKNLKAIRQQMGLVFQNPDDQLFCTTVFDDVAFGPRNLGLGEPEVGRRVSRSLAAVGLPGVEQKSAFHLSLGQKKRVAIATVLAMDSKILALDEPTSSLDPRGRKEIRQLLEHLGGTQLIVTHDLSLVRAICGHVLVISSGRIAVQGRPEELLADQTLLEAYHLD